MAGPSGLRLREDPYAKHRRQGPVVEAALGYQKYFSKDARLTGYVGLVHRNIKLSPDDPLSQVDDKDSGLKFQLELAARPAQRLDLSVMGSYTGHLGDRWFRLRPGYVGTDRIVVGPEFVSVSGENYSKRRFGLVVEGVPIGARTGLNFQLGREKDRRRGESNTYAGASFNARF